MPDFQWFIRYTATKLKAKYRFHIPQKVLQQKLHIFSETYYHKTYSLPH
jgi:hypothetical protein